MLPLDIHQLEEKLGYRFSNPALLRTALTHSSYANENLGGRADCNERLEFLGDSVLSVLVCNHLYLSYPKLPEGDLTTLRQNLVDRDALVEYAEQLGLGDFLLLGKGEEKDGRTKPKILEDAFEALLGALYLDAGNFDTVSAFLLPFIKQKLQKIEEKASPLVDYKTLLQQYVQQTPGEELHYETVGEEGPDNAKIFTVRVLINSNSFGIGRGSSKREAEQNAAREAYGRYLPQK